MQQLDITSVHC